MKCLWVWVATDHPDMLQYRLPLFVFWLLLLQSVLGNDPSAPEQTISYVLYPCFLNFWFTLITTVFVSAIRVTDIKQAQEALEVRYFLPHVIKYYNRLGKENLQWHGERMSLNKIAFFSLLFSVSSPLMSEERLVWEKKKKGTIWVWKLLVAVKCHKYLSAELAIRFCRPNSESEDMKLESPHASQRLQLLFLCIIYTSCP